LLGEGTALSGCWASAAVERDMDTHVNRGGITGNLWLQMIGLVVIVAALIVLAAKYVW
jgi:hypothetical protein